MRLRTPGSDEKEGGGKGMKLWKNQRGNEFVEAAIVLPIITLLVILLLNLFVFYLNIMVTGVREHKDIYKEWDTDASMSIKTYCVHKNVSMARTGLLDSSPVTSLEIKAYHFNEDKIVRMKGLIDEE